MDSLSDLTVLFTKFVGMPFLSPRLFVAWSVPCSGLEHILFVPSPMSHLIASLHDFYSSLKNGPRYA